MNGTKWLGPGMPPPALLSERGDLLNQSVGQLRVHLSPHGFRERRQYRQITKDQMLKQFCAAMIGLYLFVLR